MKIKTFMSITIILLAFVFTSCLVSEIVWSTKANSPDTLRQIVGLPSIAIGNLNPSVRNPGLEFFCTSLYDVPGGYCYYFAPGVPATNFTIYCNSIRSDNK
ncbi:MAG: hypothetical protein QG670_1609 [Thermoproteota archaeon]|nr:hypothetical protein [Thermoproteota archaeon]